MDLESLDKLLDSRFYYMLSISAILFSYYETLWSVRGAALAACLLMMCLELLLLWGKKSWWNPAKYILLSTFIIAVGLGLEYGYGVRSSVLLWPLIWIFAVMPEKYSSLSFFSALITGTIILFLSHGSRFGVVFNLVSLYLGLRSIRIRQDAYRTSQLHLKQLNEAHKELQQAHEELQAAAVHSMRYAALEERTRLAREIHDGIGHQLTSLIVQLQALEIMLSIDPEKAEVQVSQLLKISRQAMAEVRMAVREWSDDEMGLGLIALKGLVSQTQSRSSIQFHFVQDSEVTEWSAETSIVLYRILQESLTNILRHSNASNATVHISETEEQILLSITDDGQYTENTPLIPGFGMKGIIERCQQQGGSCTILPEKPHGLRIEVTIPVG